MRRRCRRSGSAPRVRGTVMITRCLSGIGSAPRVRGTVCLPAARNVVQPVQPRVCGERTSSIDVCPTRPRFSPACAGNGVLLCIVEDGHVGSAPRVRGTGSAKCNAGHRCRFSPACAGNGHRPWNRRYHRRFSPACAGNGCSRCIMSRDRFSPACAGNGGRSVEPGHRDRFSPACAGNGTSERSSLEPRRFSPACAGNGSACLIVMRRAFGSAPRVRGTVASGS